MEPIKKMKITEQIVLDETINAQLMQTNNGKKFFFETFSKPYNLTQQNILDFKFETESEDEKENYTRFSSTNYWERPENKPFRFFVIIHGTSEDRKVSLFIWDNSILHEDMASLLEQKSDPIPKLKYKTAYYQRNLGNPETDGLLFSGVRTERKLATNNSASTCMKFMSRFQELGFGRFFENNLIKPFI